MTRDRKVMYIIATLLFLCLFFAFFIPISMMKPLAAVICFIFLIVVNYFIKKRSILSINKNSVFLLMLVISFVYMMIYYLSGIIYGFYKSPYIISLNSIISLILPAIIIIVTIEIIRRILLAQNNKYINVITFLTCVIADCLLVTNFNAINTMNNFMDLIGLTLLPSIIGNILYHYLSKNYGCKPIIVFKLVTFLSIYLIPFVPSISDSLFAMYKLIMPLLIYWFISSLYEKKKKMVSEKPSKWRYAIASFFAVCMILIVMLISCQFKFGMIVVGSSSMTGEINKGDAVIYERYEEQIIKKDQVIVFKKDNAKIIHRVVDIKIINNQNRYYTKGDANEDLDYGYITDKDIIGLVNFKIAFIGYPTIWINELFS